MCSIKHDYLAVQPCNILVENCLYAFNKARVSKNLEKGKVTHHFISFSFPVLHLNSVKRTELYLSRTATDVLRKVGAAINLPSWQV